MNYLIIMRHGQSRWNLENRFTGWEDVDLTAVGEDEACRAGELIKDFPIDAVYSSTLKRARRTVEMALDSADEAGANLAGLRAKDGWRITHDDALRERDYGDLVGLNKAETAEKYGDEQVRLWRRGFEVCPPNGESLADVVERVRPYYYAEIGPLVETGRNVLISAHGNSLRALLLILGEYTADEIPNVELPTGRPLVFEFTDGVKQKSYYLDD
ncbi:MAG: 2,3-bisphosphoglycerate-dependent phosphoglycerate mutase [Alphaproteobacteria bacterium]|mgnify:CR=1 FL=1|nr:2,3-bisphosphoglycerate-dependent phosphoglycerate mutase [Alphaproteobacteria bacterium]